ncbi:MAG: HNH endonuclease [Planctomycetes bacterium]|nr:HNH endonuclease [Planctomycetota bacterium]
MSDDTAIGEEWRPIPGTDGLYCVSTLGRVRSQPLSERSYGRGGILRPGRDTKGYLQFKICMPNGKHQTIKVHRVVALTFLGSRPDGHQINHISGDKTDNSVANLEYVTCAENIRHANRMGLYRKRLRGEANRQAKVNAEQVRTMRALHATTSLSALATRFGVTKSNVSQIIRRKTWRHVA